MVYCSLRHLLCSVELPTRSTPHTTRVCVSRLSHKQVMPAANPLGRPRASATAHPDVHPTRARSGSTCSPARAHGRLAHPHGPTRGPRHCQFAHVSTLDLRWAARRHVREHVGAQHPWLARLCGALGGRGRAPAPSSSCCVGRTARGPPWVGHKGRAEALDVPHRQREGDGRRRREDRASRPRAADGRGRLQEKRCGIRA